MRVRLFVLTAALVFASAAAFAIDHGYDPNDATVKWFRHLLRPGHEKDHWSCCGEADAYQVESYYRDDQGRMIAVIGDGSAKQFPNGEFRKPVPDGTKIVVPDGLINNAEDDLDNPTDESWIFLAPPDPGAQPYMPHIYCFVRHPKGT